MADEIAKHLIFGFECGPSADWEKFVPAPKAPANYKNPEKIAEYERDALSKLVEHVPEMPLAGEVRRGVVLGLAGETLFDGKGRELYVWLNARLEMFNEALAEDSDEDPIALIGFDIRDRLHQCAIAAARHGIRAGSWGLFLSNVFGVPQEVRLLIRLCDPGRAIVGSAAGLQPREMLRLYLTGILQCGWTNDAVGEARFALDAAQAFGLNRPVF